MGAADLIPGVSGGTIAFITGIYANLLAAISSIGKEAVQHLLGFRIARAISVVHVRFLIILGAGVGTSVISMAKLVHYLLHEHAIHTWSLFLGLIAGSIIVIGGHIEKLWNAKNLATILGGAVFAHIVVNLIPVETPEAYWFIFLCGVIAITAMILPGISGSFLLLILGKYAFITGALKGIHKTPFADNDIQIMFVFGCGALVGLLGFSKVLNHIMNHYYSLTMCFLTGVLIGSLQKVWPWREVLESRVVRGKEKILREGLLMPDSFNASVALAVFLIVAGFVGVILLDRLANKGEIAQPAE